MVLKRRVLVFSDFESIRNIIVTSLQKQDFEVVGVATYDDALRELNGPQFGIVIIDKDVKNNKAISFIDHLREITLYMYTPIILTYSTLKDVEKEELTPYKIACYLNKPFDMREFHSIINKLI